MRAQGLKVAALLMAATAAQATTLRQMSLAELAAESAAIVRARAVSSVSRWENGMIWTFTSFEVVETLKGSAESPLQVRLVGGRVGSLTSRVEGVPRFRDGEEVFLFLARSPGGEWTVTGWTLGTFRVQRGRDGETVTQDTAGATLFDPATRQFRPGGARRLPVEEFRRRVAEAVTRHSGRQP